MADYSKLASTVLEKVGGKENVENVVHCLTRLRFTLKDLSLAKKDEIEEIPGVLGTMVQSNQFQVIIGETVPDVYEVLCKIGGFMQEEAIDENLDGATQKKKFGIGPIFEVISGCFAPVVAAFAGAGVLKGLLILLTSYGLMSNESGLYLILNAAGDSVFYFLPFVLAFTSAKKMKTNEVLAIAIAGIYMYPTILEGAGTQANLFGYNFYLVKYASTVLPIIMSVWIMSYIYRWLSKVTPSFLRVVVVPLGTLVVMAPLSLVVIGPIGYNVSIYVGEFFKWLFEAAPVVGGFVDGFTRPLVVFTGTHMMLQPVMINNIEVLGYDMLGPVHCAATYAAAGMCLGAFLKARNTNNKSSSFSALISGLIGITEPALYGVAFRFKKPLIAVMIGGGVGGAVTALLGGKAISFAMPSLVSLPAYTGTIPEVMIGLVVAFVLTAVLTYVLGFDEKIEKDQRAIEAEKKNVTFGKK